jgi:hypothetical protein
LRALQTLDAQQLLLVTKLGTFSAAPMFCASQGLSHCVTGATFTKVGNGLRVSLGTTTGPVQY